MLKLAFGGVLLLSLVAGAQTEKPAGIATLDSNPSLNPTWSYCNHRHAGTTLAEDVFTVRSFGLDVCPQGDLIRTALDRDAVSAAATSLNLPQAPSAVRFGPNGTAGIPDSEGTRSVSQTPAPAATSSRRTLDRKFILLQTLSTLAMVADLETTAHVFAAQPKANELNPLFGRRPTRVRLYGIGVPVDALIFYMSYHAKKAGPKRRIWEIGPALSIAVHSAAAINNLILLRR